MENSTARARQLISVVAGGVKLLEAGEVEDRDWAIGQGGTGDGLLRRPVSTARGLRWNSRAPAVIRSASPSLWRIVDYKTDLVRAAEVPSLLSRYKSQLDLCRDALARTGIAVVNVALLSTATGVASLRLSPKRLSDLRLAARLERG